MKLHKLLAEAVVDNLKAIFSEEKFADKVIAASLRKNAKWGSRDRKFIAESTYEIVRHYRLFFTAAGTKNPWPVFAAYLVSTGIGLPDWKELQGISENRIKKSMQENAGFFSVEQSVPDWLDELGRRELKDKWEEEMTALNQEAKVVLRANSLKTSANALREQLLNHGVETVLHPDVPEALILLQRQNVFSLPEFKKGFYELQDISSQRVAHFMQLKEGLRIIDACAGGGGKSLHIAALMKNKGKIISMDIRQNKLDELKKRAARAGVFNIGTRIISEENTRQLNEFADRVLLDAPCSGLGVLRRNPDAKWKLSVDAVEQVKKAQSAILFDYSKMVKIGGKLIYATCSVLPSENSGQINKFLESNPMFQVEEEKVIMPSDGFDGFYMCRMIRKG